VSQPRLRLESCRLEDGIWHIDTEQARHLVKVRRCYNGSVVEGLLNGEKLQLKLRGCETDDICAVEISRMQEKLPGCKLQLMLALLKNDQFDEALRFAAETGVSEIFLVACERSVPKISEKLDGKIGRWNKILAEATKQSGAATAPVLHEPVAFCDFNFSAVSANRFAALLADETAAISSVDFATDAVIAIGPEGDWSPEEMTKLIAEKFIPISLGTRILRASTAVAVACGWVANAGLQ